MEGLGDTVPGAWCGCCDPIRFLRGKPSAPSSLLTEAWDLSFSCFLPIHFYLLV
jgi:hypothetical protein